MRRSTDINGDVSLLFSFFLGVVDEVEGPGLGCVYQQTDRCGYRASRMRGPSLEVGYTGGVE